MIPMLTPDLRHLVHDATTYARQHHDDADHTVAAALRTDSGRTIMGLNAYHFLGGPCGEISALAHHAATCPEDPVRAVVAVYGPTGQVISPCGKCRQVLYDIDPLIRCVIRTPAGLETRTIRELLPHPYDQRTTEQPQHIYMWEGYEGAIRSGAKHQTIRVDDPFTPGPALLVFEKDSGETVTIPAEVTSVRNTRRDALTDDDAVADGFEDLPQLHSALDTHYPGLGPADPVDVVTFRLTEHP